MWCRTCNRGFSEKETICPVCNKPLLEQPDDAPPELELLMEFQDEAELDMAMDILDQHNIPYLSKSLGQGNLRVVLGENPEGTALYVMQNFTHRAMRLLQRFDPAFDEPFDEEALYAAVEEYQSENPRPEDVATPAGARGFRTAVWFFVAILGLIAVLALLSALF